MATTLLGSGADGVMRCGMSQMLDLLSPNPVQVQCNLTHSIIVRVLVYRIGFSIVCRAYLLLFALERSVGKQRKHV